MHKAAVFLLLSLLLPGAHAATSDCDVPLSGHFRGHLPPPGAGHVGVAGEKVYFALHFDKGGGLEASWVGDTTMVRGRGSWSCANDKLVLRYRIDDAPGDESPREETVVLAAPEPEWIVLTSSDGVELRLRQLPTVDAGNPFGLAADTPSLTAEGQEHLRCAAMYAAINVGEPNGDADRHLAIVLAEVGQEAGMLLTMDAQMKASMDLSVAAGRRVSQGMRPREYFARLIEPCEGLVAP